MHSLLKGNSNAGPIALALFGLLLLGIAIRSVLWLSADGNSFTIRGLAKRRVFDREACEFGLRYNPSSRSPSFTIVVTDSQQFEDIADRGSEQRARAVIARLCAGLFNERDEGKPSKRRKRAQAEISSLEREWKQHVDQSQQIIDAYYRSPAWRTSKLVVVGGVVLYAIVMAIYAYFAEGAAHPVTAPAPSTQDSVTN